MKTRFILIETSHAGNVGAAARAIKTMGFDDLVLVAPRSPDLLERQEAIARASGARDVLERARSVATLDQALAGISHLCATAMTARDFGPPTAQPRAYLEMLAKRAQQTQYLPEHGPESANDLQAPQQTGVAFLFGPERFGLSNAHVYRCHVALSIPANPGFASLNLAAAVQLIAYEWRLALGGFAAPAGGAAPGAHSGAPAAAADAAQLAGMLAHWQQALEQIGFLDPAAPKKLMPRINRLFNRAQPTAAEIHILRGIARAMLAAAQRANR